jgi:hypothetical protein
MHFTAGLDAVEKSKFSADASPGIWSSFLGHPAHSLVTVLPELSRLHPRLQHDTHAGCKLMLEAYVMCTCPQGSCRADWTTTWGRGCLPKCDCCVWEKGQAWYAHDSLGPGHLLAMCLSFWMLTVRWCRIGEQPY